MQSANTFNEEQIPNGVQRSPLEALDKAINTADTGCSLLDTLREPEQLQEIHVPSPVEMTIPESQGPSPDNPTSAVCSSAHGFHFWLWLDKPELG